MNFKEFLLLFKTYENNNNIVRYILLTMFFKNYIKKYKDS